jgi:endonuclease-3
MTPNQILDALGKLYPNAHCELYGWKTDFEFLVCIMLSAQSTDAMVNKVVPDLFLKYPSIDDFCQCDPKELENSIRLVGLANFKAANIIKCAQILRIHHGGRVPTNMKDLIALPGVGRKTANVFLTNYAKINEGVVVDTHVTRLSHRMGLSSKKKPHQIENDLMRLFPKAQWGTLGHLLTWHGRRMCSAIKPNCPDCPLQESCPKIGA